MVNYCCVYGCGRNTKTHQNLSFYSLPNDKHRKVAWLKAAGREDLVEKLLSQPNDSSWSAAKSSSRRFCSRHFAPEDIKNKSRHLGADVIPTLYLPGTWEGEQSDDEHADIACNYCQKPVVGFRYKCVTCDDFDLCHNCNHSEMHREHFMLRIPKPLKFKLADNLIKKWRKLFNKDHVTPEALAKDDETALSDESSDDDQPITKYAKNYDSGIDLSEDVKEQIRKEIQRVTSLKLDQQHKTKKTAKLQKKKEDKRRQANENDSERERIILPKKRMKMEQNESSFAGNSAPDVVFADVNDVKCEYPNIMPVISTVTGSARQPPKPQLSRTPTETYSYPSVCDLPPPPVLIPAPTYPVIPTPVIPQTSELPSQDMQQPVMHVKLSDDLTELMIEVAGTNERTFYKYPESNVGGNV